MKYKITRTFPTGEVMSFYSPVEEMNAQIGSFVSIYLLTKSSIEALDKTIVATNDDGTVHTFKWEVIL